MISALTIGLAAAGSTFVVRAIVDEFRPELLLVKPFSCDLCMNWWGSLGLTLMSAIDSGLGAAACVESVLAGTAVGVLATKTANRLAT